MKKTSSFVLVALTASILSLGAHAQSAPIHLDKTGVVPYATDATGEVVRDPYGLCWRAAGIWSKDLALSVKTIDGDKLPVGCYCDPAELPKDACQVTTAEPAKAAEPAKIVEPAQAPDATPTAEKVTIPADTLFAFDKADLTDAGKEKLAAFASNAKQLKQLEVIIAVGHADRIGSDTYNQKLSERRATTVKNFLIDQGIPDNKVFTEGKGESQPVTDNEYKKLGRFNGKNKKLVDFFAPDRRVVLEAIGTK